jgi:hypothetical protein
MAGRLSGLKFRDGEWDAFSMTEFSGALPVKPSVRGLVEMP